MTLIAVPPIPASGDSGWFPGYPWLVGAVHALGLPLRGSAVAISWLFAAATLVLLWNTFLGRRTDALAVGALVYAAWAPGQIYEYAVFPMSMLAFFTIAHLWLLHRSRYIAAGFAGAAAALTYPLGVLLVAVSAAWLLAQRASPLAQRLRHITYTSGIMLAGVAVFIVDQKLETGHWNAYLLVQDRYHHNLQSPIAGTWDSFRPLLHGSPFQYVKGPPLQTAVVTAALLAVGVAAAVRRRTLNRSDGLILLWAVVTWAVPLSQGGLSIQRSQAAMLPLAVLVPRLPRPLQVALIVTSVGVAIAMENLFFHGDII